MDRRNFGSDASGGVNDATKAYKADPIVQVLREFEESVIEQECLS